MKKTTKGKARKMEDEKRLTKLVRTGLKCGYDRDRECWENGAPPGKGVPDPFPGGNGNE